MTEDVTLTQLAAEVIQLRQQLETMSQQLDMIYGAVARLADQISSAKPSSPQATPNPQPNPTLSPTAMMDPGNMLDALRQHATQLGLDISTETVEHLKTQTQTGSATDEEPTTTD